jgi:hypothetical protein
MEEELLKIFRKYKIIATGSDQVIIAEIIEVFNNHTEPYEFLDSEK